MYRPQIQEEQLCFFNSSDIEMDVSVKIGNLLGYHQLNPDDLKQPDSEIVIAVMLYPNDTQNALLPHYVFKSIKAAKSARRNGLLASLGSHHAISTIDEWVVFPIKFRDLNPSSRIVLTVHDVSSSSTATLGYLFVVVLFQKYFNLFNNLFRILFFLHVL